MIDVAILKTVGFSALGLLVLGWLVVSFQSPGRVQQLTARFASLLMYVALACLFTHLVQENWEKGRAVLYIPFGFLLGVFLLGTCLTLVKGARELGSAGGESAASATH